MLIGEFPGVISPSAQPDAIAKVYPQVQNSCALRTHSLLILTMDYSAAAADPALQGSSPWRSSSPRADRTGFSAPDSDVPDSPVPGPQHSHSHSQDSISANPFASEPGTPAVPPPQPASPEIQATQDQTQAAPPTAPQPQRAPSQQQQKQPQIRPGAARYQSARQQRPVPAYKLQAKVTALERTGRKDPVIRFDVYVGRAGLLIHSRTDSRRPIYPSSERLSFVMFAEHTQNSSSSPSTSFLPIPKLLFPQSLPA